MTPAEVNTNNEELVRARLYPPKPKSHKWKYDVSDKVRITMRRQPFAKGYLGRWSREMFEIDARLPTVPVTYRLKDNRRQDLLVCMSRAQWANEHRSRTFHATIDPGNLWQMVDVAL